MTAVPFVSRLAWQDYMGLALGMVLVTLEGAARFAAICLPSNVLDLLYRMSQHMMNFVRRPALRETSVEKMLHDAPDFETLARVAGYEAQFHVVQTMDGYTLGVHRICTPRKDGANGDAAPARHRRKPVVYLHHGLMMNSEVWICNIRPENCLAYQLVEQGYDVWFGNNRGNKYGRKNHFHAPNTNEFWNFCIDDFAMGDIPATIEYILHVTGHKKLSYVGFSQGTAQAFASLSLGNKVADHVDVFVALAPAMSPNRLHSSVVNALMRASPAALFLIFGRRSLLPSTAFWESIMYPPFFVKVLDASLYRLFGWRCANMSLVQKLAAYSHLYSCTSVKSLVHWFQIIRAGRFQMYDDELSIYVSSKHYVPMQFPTRNIRVPVCLVYGGSDSLVDIDLLLRELPAQTQVTCVEHYEHIDMLWADDVGVCVVPHVLKYLETRSSCAIDNDP